MWACRLADPGSVRDRWPSLPALVQSAPAARPLNWGWLGAKISLSGTLISAALMGACARLSGARRQPSSAATIALYLGKPGYVTNVRGRSSGLCVARQANENNRRGRSERRRCTIQFVLNWPELTGRWVLARWAGRGDGGYAASAYRMETVQTLYGAFRVKGECSPRSG
jgi:hypothetical protein